MTRRRVFAAVFALLAVSVVTGCASNDSLAQQYRDGNEKGYIAGDFQVVQILESDRGEPVAFEGLTETGERVTSDDYRGGVLVVNFWYAACGPCIVEAPLLPRVAARLDDMKVSGYSILPVVAGRGRAGSWTADGQVSDAVRMMALVCIADATQVNDIVAAVFEVIARQIGLVAVSDVLVVRPERF